MQLCILWYVEKGSKTHTHTHTHKKKMTPGPRVGHVRTCVMHVHIMSNGCQASRLFFPLSRLGWPLAPVTGPCPVFTFVSHTP